ncbi:MAG: class I SAM-dependent methyltransferase [Thermoanaerobaculia bacterium]
MNDGNPTRAGRWWIVRDERAEHRDSPEFRFLSSWVESEVRAVAGEVRVASTGDQRLSSRDGVGDDDLVLEWPDETLVLRSTLAALAAEIAGGAEAAAPESLSAIAPPAGEIVRTLAAFERLERDRLAAPAVELPAGDEPPLVLWRGDAWRRARSAATAGEPTLAAARRAGIRRARRGVAHRFADYYGQARADVLPLVPAGVGEVLEIGCGDGATGELLERRLGCRVTGVELNPVVAARAATRLTRVVPGDVLAVGIDGAYDLILALELFEHLTDQDAFLAKMRPLLRPGGHLLLSVPNVGHLSLVEDLLAGRFDYIPVGLLCFTHYRFFTRASLAAWFARCGWPEPEIVDQGAALPERAERWLAAAEAAGLEVDRESLATTGFFVRARV